MKKMKFAEMADLADELEKANLVRIEYNREMAKIGKEALAKVADSYWKERKATALSELRLRKCMAQMLFDKIRENRGRGLPTDDLIDAYIENADKIDYLQATYDSAVILTQGSSFAKLVRDLSQ